MPKTLKEVSADVMKIFEVIFGTDSKGGLVSKIAVMNWKVNAIGGMQVLIVGILVKILIDIGSKQ